MLTFNSQYAIKRILVADFQALAQIKYLPKTYQSLNLTKNGAFEGQFVVDSLSITIPFNMFYYDQTSRFVLTDIDGTITESDIKGHVFPVFGFSAHHDHVVEMFHKIGDNGYNVVYLTARSIASDIDTREYLFEVSCLFQSLF